MKTELLRNYSIWNAGCKFTLYNGMYVEMLGCLHGIGQSDMKTLIDKGFAKLLTP